VTYTTEVNTTHVERAQAKLLGTLKRPRLLAMVASGASESQRIETLAHQVAGQLNLDSTYDWILDAIGRLVGRGRGSSTTNDVYRIGLRAQIRINRSFGRTIDLTDIQRLSKPGGVWRNHEYPPASLTTYLESAIAQNEVEQIRTNLAQQKGLGVRLDWVVYFSANAGRFGTITDPGVGSVGLDHVATPLTDPGLSSHAIRIRNTL
jgi:hypothetical protein